MAKPRWSEKAGKEKFAQMGWQVDSFDSATWKPRLSAPRDQLAEHDLAAVDAYHIMTGRKQPNVPNPASASERDDLRKRFAENRGLWADDIGDMSGWLESSTTFFTSTFLAGPSNIGTGRALNKKHVVVKDAAAHYVSGTTPYSFGAPLYPDIQVPLGGGINSKPDVIRQYSSASLKAAPNTWTNAGIFLANSFNKPRDTASKLKYMKIYDVKHADVKAMPFGGIGLSGFREDKAVDLEHLGQATKGNEMNAIKVFDQGQRAGGCGASSNVRLFDEVNRDLSERALTDYEICLYSAVSVLTLCDNNWVQYLSIPGQKVSGKRNRVAELKGRKDRQIWHIKVREGKFTLRPDSMAFGKMEERWYRWVDTERFDFFAKLGPRMQRRAESRGISQ